MPSSTSAQKEEDGRALPGNHTGIDDGLAQGAEGPTRPRTPGDPGGISHLTPRERQVLILIGQAAPNRAISRQLAITERTVKAHLANLMMKVGVSTRIEAAIFAYVHHHAIRRPAA
ncbi:helix-turn-helix domain-containing protein [Streptomyces sp. G7(2002)]|uniref:helix-turn-helix domain-containing protein n=1 Tax=Streptomyces sp. G7(2002) TaxID=2971798 RepID=UPI00237DF8BD|nr:helix-turn-helix transcriptional regulator [Streptomyces sp. G7(2002)]WDT52601.1 helix-turn-helix transcriptional regulator [Streptomyces sp. G7(2002)]